MPCKYYGHSMYTECKSLSFQEQEARTKLLRNRVKNDSQSGSIQSTSSASLVHYDEPGHINLFSEEKAGSEVRNWLWQGVGFDPGFPLAFQFCSPLITHKYHQLYFSMQQQMLNMKQKRKQNRRKRRKHLGC